MPYTFQSNEKPKLGVEIDANDMINLVLGGNVTDEYIVDLKKWGEEVKKAMKTVSQRTGGTVYTIIDISEAHEFDEAAMRVIRDLMEFNKTYATRTATFGGSIYSVMAQDTLMVMTGRTNMKAFKTKEEAVKWLYGK